MLDLWYKNAAIYSLNVANCKDGVILALPRYAGSAERVEEARMPLSETACEILEFFRETHRKPGALIAWPGSNTHDRQSVLFRFWPSRHFVAAR